MAGDKDELVGSDEMVDKLTEPSQKVTYQDLWNAAYRGFVPGGLNQKGDSSAPVLPDGGDDAEPFSETPVSLVEPEEVKRPDAVPVVIFDDLSRVAGSVERYFHAFQATVGNVGTTLLLNRDPRRTRVRIVNSGPGFIVIGETESVGLTGFPMNAVIPTLESTAILDFSTTRQVWAQQIEDENELGVPASVAIFVEYEKEI
jgi:hypothetical protein